MLVCSVELEDSMVCSGVLSERLTVMLCLSRAGFYSQNVPLVT